MILWNLAVRAARKPPIVRSGVVLLALFIASIAAADTVRVTVDRALIWNRPDGISVVLSQVRKDAVLQVQRRVGDWFEVLLPPGSSRGAADVGYIRASQVQLEPGDLPPPPPSGLRPSAGEPARRAIPSSDAAALSPSSSVTAFFNIDATYRRGTKTFKRTVAAFEDRYAEAGQVSTTYGRGNGLQLDLMGGRSVWGPIGVGFGFAYHQREEAAHVEAQVPHPFFFNQLRDATFTTAGLKREEITFHIPVLWMPEFGLPVKVMVFGGPAFFRVEQVTVTDVTISESYPYDVVAIGAVTTSPRSGTRPGFMTGADVAYMIGRTIGVGAGVRYGRAKIKFRNDETATVEGDAGGLLVLAGLRYRF